MKIFSTLFLACLCMVYVSCKKNETNNTPTKMDHITAGPWVHESSGVDVGRDGTIDIPMASLGTIPACRLDNLLTFRKDGTAVADEGATKCEGTDPQTSTFNWAFADNETSLQISGNVFTQLNGKSNIRTLNATTLSLSKDTTVAPFGNVAIVVNLKH
jgi:hypothetical protein